MWCTYMPAGYCSELNPTQSPSGQDTAPRAARAQRQRDARLCPARPSVEGVTPRATRAILSPREGIFTFGLRCTQQYACMQTLRFVCLKTAMNIGQVKLDSSTPRAPSGSQNTPRTRLPTRERQQARRGDACAVRRAMPP